MVITTLVENSTVSKKYKNKHGLCFHVATEKHNLLFDLGPDKTFIDNAEKLNIDIKDVDIVVISHGHKDHGGGLEAFLNYNSKAKIYISKFAFGDHYASVLKYLKIYVGLNKKLINNERIIFTDEIYKIDEELILISKVSGDLLIPGGNKDILVKEKGKYFLDDFRHEQSLLINENNNNILISGCSHAGVLNIIEKVESATNTKIDFLLGGLHLYNPINRKTEKLDFINELSNELIKKDIKIYTCHCTGEKAFKILKKALGNKIDDLKTGQSITL